MNGSAQPQLLVRPDGRRLAWYEYGDPDGTPCVYTTGTPASGLAGAMFDDAAAKAGVRWISLDKPGYGFSDPVRGRRRLVDWPQDVAAVADRLGLSTFAAAGESGGGPHVLAVAHGLPSRVTTAVVIAGLGPGTEAWVREGMKSQNRMLFGLSQRAPWALWPAFGLMGWMLTNPQRRRKYLQSQLRDAPAADRQVLAEHPEVLELSMVAAADAFRFGPRGAVQELAMFARPWGFELSDITTHVDLWHGTDDVNVPVSVARHVADLLPDCDARIVEGGGHSVGFVHVDDIMQAVVSAATSEARTAAAG